MTTKPPALLVITSEFPLSADTRERIVQAFSPIAEQVGMLVAVMDQGLKAEVHRDLSHLVEALQAQTHAIQMLIEQNAALIQAMADEEEEGEPDGYLSLKRR